MKTHKLDTRSKIFIISAVAITLAVIVLSGVVLSLFMPENYDTDWMKGKPVWLIKLRYGGFDYENESSCGYFIEHKDLFGDTVGKTNVTVHFNEHRICTRARQVTSS